MNITPNAIKWLHILYIARPIVYNIIVSKRLIIYVPRSICRL